MSSEAYNVLSDDPCPNIMFFCSLCRPKVTLALKFFNEIQEKQTELESRLTEMEKQLEQSQQSAPCASAEPITHSTAATTNELPRVPRIRIKMIASSTLLYMESVNVVKVPPDMNV